MPLVVRQEGKRNYNENEMFGGGALEEVFAMGAPLWLASGRQARAGVRFFIAAVPATLVAVFAGIVALLALFLDKGRRDYALNYADRCVDFAAVLVGSPRPASLIKAPSIRTNAEIRPAPRGMPHYCEHKDIVAANETDTSPDRAAIRSDEPTCPCSSAPI